MTAIPLWVKLLGGIGVVAAACVGLTFVPSGDVAYAPIAPIDLDGLLQWFFVERLGGSIPANLDLHAVNRGYRDRDSFIQALLREYYYSR